MKPEKAIPKMSFCTSKSEDQTKVEEMSQKKKRNFEFQETAF